MRDGERLVETGMPGAVVTRPVEEARILQNRGKHSVYDRQGDADADRRVGKALPVAKDKVAKGIFATRRGLLPRSGAMHQEPPR